MLRIVLSHDTRRPEDGRLAGGDLVTFARYDDANMTFMIGDLSAKGSIAAQLALRLARAFRFECASNGLPSTILKRLNEFLCAAFASLESGLFATAFVCRLSTNGEYCIYSSAGAEAPILRKDNGFFQTLPPLPGAVLGVESDSRYKDFVMPIEVNDTLIGFTGGISESIRADGGGRLGAQGVIEAINAVLDRKNSLEPCDLLFEIDRLNGHFYHDDATLLTASVR